MSASIQDARKVLAHYHVGVVCVGIVGNAMCMHVFRKQRIKAYKLQLVIALVDWLYCLDAIMQQIESIYNVIFNAAPKTLTASFEYMFFTARLMNAMSNSLLTNSALLTLCVAVDRLVATAKPLWYHKLAVTCRLVPVYAIAVGLSGIISAGTSAHDAFRFNLAFNQTVGAYLVIPNMFVNTVQFKTLEWIRTVLRFAVGVGVLLSTCSFIRLYNKSLASVGVVAAPNAVNIIKDKQAIMRLLIVYACLVLFRLLFTSVLFLSSTYVGAEAIAMPTFQVFRTVSNMVLVITFSANFMLYYIMCKEFRQMFMLCLLKAVRRCCGKQAITPANSRVMNISMPNALLNRLINCSSYPQSCNQQNLCRM